MQKIRLLFKKKKKKRPRPTIPELNASKEQLCLQQVQQNLPSYSQTDISSWYKAPQTLTSLISRCTAKMLGEQQTLCSRKGGCAPPLLALSSCQDSYKTWWCTSWKKSYTIWKGRLVGNGLRHPNCKIPPPHKLIGDHTTV